ncbi:MAG: hypothetical protein ACR2H2_06065 [Solirubrobacteraceae bacterium]
MPLTLVTGPANAEKAGVVLDGYRAALHRGQARILVVPTLADVDHYRTELAAGGVVFAAHAARRQPPAAAAKATVLAAAFGSPGAVLATLLA